MKTEVAYGTGLLSFDIGACEAQVIRPKPAAPLSDPFGSIRASLRAPIGSRPLRDLISANDTVAIVFSDITRPIPYKLILPVLLEELAEIPDNQIILMNALGTHRPNTPAELEEILGAEIAARFQIVQPDCHDKSQLTYLGLSKHGHPIWINKTYMDCSFRILTGFIEPHLFAGFSGGPKAVLPGIAGFETICANHSAVNIGTPGVDFGFTTGNPIWEEMLDTALQTEPVFLLNITQDENRRITAVFSGSLEPAHRAGIEFVLDTSFQPVDGPFDIVITTAGGYPLDISLYQSVKGIAVARRIVKPGGTILLVTECKEGMPEFGEYGDLMRLADTPHGLLHKIHTDGFFMQDQWDAQIQAQICTQSSLYIYSDGLTDDEIRSAFGVPCRDLDATLQALLNRYGPNPRLAVLPYGPFAVPYIDPNSGSRE